MSDKDKPNENKLSDDETIASNGAAITDNDSDNDSDNNNQQGLSASINLTTASVDKQDKSQDKKSTSTDTSTKSKPPIKKDRNMNKASIEKNAASTQKKARTTTTAQQQNKGSKTAILALIIALLAIAASAGHYYWNEQQKSVSIAQLTQQLSNKLQKQLQQKQATLTQQLLQQEQQNNKQLIAIKKRVEDKAQKNIAQLQQQITNLKQNQPSDWLLHEAEYLIRVASRSLWLEKDTTAAIGLLNDADRRIEELDDPQFLPVRQIIQQDIAELQLLPTLNTDNVILKLMALAEQTKQLPLTMVDIPASNEQTSDLELSDDASDWQENLAKTWRKFLADFITVSRRTGNVEPLMSPKFTQNLRENLNLKIQTAIFAATKGKTKIYQQSLTDIQTWLTDYFDMTEITNQNFSQALLALASETINVDYPNKLVSLAVIREVITNNSAPAPTQLPVKPVTIEAKETSNAVPASSPQENEPQENESQEAETKSAQPEDA